VSSASDKLALRVTDLVAGYGQRPIARLGALSLRTGESALLIGDSGSGKTTLLLAIAGLARTMAGRVEIGESDVSDFDAAARDRFRGEHIGFVFQDIHLVTGLSAIDNVLLAPFVVDAPQDRDRARRLLAAVGLADRIEQPAQTLSRGQAQRVAIARALLLRPQLIVADEPTASLDDDACEAVADLLRTTASENGAALLIATHDRRLRDRFSMHVAVECVS
jgi:putative ABC transport system ATP-binding protein